MSRNVHEQARELIALDGTEELRDGQQNWLRAHLQECAACRDYAEAAGRVVQAIRLQPFAADSELVRTTQMRVRARAAERRQQQEQIWLVCLAGLFVGLSGAVTTPLFWRSFEWMGLWAGVSSWVWQAAFTYFWITPALVVSAVLLTRGTHLAGNKENRWI